MKRLLPIILLTFPLACRSGAPINPQNPPSPSVADAPAQVSLEPVLSESMQRIFERSCRACHGPDGHGIAAIAPDLRRAAQRDVAAWKHYLLGTHPGAQPPTPVWLSETEAEAVAAYLIELTQPAAKSDATTR